MSDHDHPSTTPGSGSGDAAGGSHRRPVLLQVALGLVLLEGLALATLAALMVVDIVSVPPGERVTMVSLAVALLGLAALLALGARALWQGRRWARGMVVTWQLLQFLIGVSALGSDAWWGTVLPAVVAVIALIGLLAPASRGATDGRGRPDVVL